MKDNIRKRKVVVTWLEEVRNDAPAVTPAQIRDGVLGAVNKHRREEHGRIDWDVRAIYDLTCEEVPA